MKTKWTEDNSATLRRLWAAGMSCASIAAQIEGATKNSVIGRAHRLDLPPHQTGRVHVEKQPRAPRQASTRKPGRAKPASQFPRLAVWTRMDPGVPVIPTYLHKSKAWLALPGSMPETLVDVEGCRWPIGEDRPYTFCACPQQAGSSYCATHAALSAGRGTQSERSAISSAKSMARAA